ncbi:MAG: nitroreductase family protein [Clostridia bacterium]|nr:nitroreductase family protein [Clostridia bacterium]
MIGKGIINSFRQYVRKFRKRRKLSGYMAYDQGRLRCYSLGFSNSESNLQAEIILRYHLLEKGLVMPNFRSAFGVQRVQELLNLLQDYIRLNYDIQNTQFIAALKVIRKYYERHVRETTEGTDFKMLMEKIESFLNRYEPLVSDINMQRIGGGARQVTRSACLHGAKEVWPAFAASRHTVRDLVNKHIPSEDVKAIVEWACACPSPCNRQAHRVYNISDLTLIGQILDLQGGARGFNHAINKLLMICGDLSFYDGLCERNQVYLDCGIFSLSVLLGIHYKGYGGCMMHWCVEPERDVLLRKLLPQIRSSHAIACLIGIGHLKDEFSVAFSQRRDVDEVLIYNGDDDT